MSEYNFIRFFVILNEYDKEYAQANKTPSPAGYCKVESMNNKSVFTLSIRGMAPQQEYEVYILMSGVDAPISAGQISTLADGTGYKNFQTTANNIFDSGAEISTAEAVLISADDGIVPLYGCINRNISRTKNDVLKKKIEVLKESFVQKTTDFLPEEIEEEPIQEDAQIVSLSSNEKELPDEKESQITNIETENERIEIEKEDEAKETGTNEGNDNSLASYAQTIARLYDGIMSAASGGKNNQTNKGAEQENSYWDMVKNYYGDLFKNNEEISPFEFFSDNTKWVLINPYDSKCMGGILTGIVYENGEAKYVITGVPVYASAPCTCAVTENMLWAPASVPNFCGVIGYWLTFIDAKTGRVTCPELKVR